MRSFYQAKHLAKRQDTGAGPTPRVVMASIVQVHGRRVDKHGVHARAGRARVRVWAWRRAERRPCPRGTRPSARCRRRRPRQGQAEWAVTGEREGKARGVESGRSSPPRAHCAQNAPTGPQSPREPPPESSAGPPIRLQTHENALTTHSITTSNRYSDQFSAACYSNRRPPVPHVAISTFSKPDVRPDMIESARAQQIFPPVEQTRRTTRGVFVHPHIKFRDHRPGHLAERQNEPQRIL